MCYLGFEKGFVLSYGDGKTVEVFGEEELLKKLVLVAGLPGWEGDDVVEQERLLVGLVGVEKAVGAPGDGGGAHLEEFEI